MKKRVEPSAPQAREIRRVKARLRPLLPPGVKVDVEVLEGLGDCGQSWPVSKNRWSIVVDSALDEVGFLDTLVHEFAHVLAGHAKEPEGPHGPLWGVCYALCYRRVNE